MLHKFFRNWKKEIIEGHQASKKALAAKHHWSQDPLDHTRLRWRFATHWGDYRWSTWCHQNTETFTSINIKPNQGDGWYPDPLEETHNKKLLETPFINTVFGMPLKEGLLIRYVKNNEWTDYVHKVYGEDTQPFIRMYKNPERKATKGICTPYMSWEPPEKPEPV